MSVWVFLSEHRLVPEREGPVGVCGYLSDSSSGSSGMSSRRRHSHSPTRVRFQDESEVEAEHRYLERQRQRSHRPPDMGRATARGRGQDRNSSSIYRKRRGLQGAGPMRERRCRYCETFRKGTPLPCLNPAPLTPPLSGPALHKWIRSPGGQFYHTGSPPSCRGWECGGPVFWEVQEEGGGPDPLRALLDGPDTQQARPKLSLRQFFSAIGLNVAGWLRPGRASSVELRLPTWPRLSKPKPRPQSYL
ncbi:hypothetical protein SKAU_G00423140 [Synaphobranchus kaupii]|uniref:DUF4685 domain-containing protein n=1 Tax=Synaphobranchus kaupii TaxID=118154 RepID=A0A9Q1E5G2_SYNKA|nr:hypothetical protein SKAU_G00423140 [Synaphobranchus kaupii]